jgi:hypothetical protein
MTSAHLAILTRDAANLSLAILNRLLFPKTRQVLARLRSNPGKMLILRTGTIGDTACALPALATLRENFPRSHICLLTSPGPRGLPEAKEVVESLGPGGRDHPLL